jgi:hypothetical protein
VLDLWLGLDDPLLIKYPNCGAVCEVETALSGNRCAQSVSSLRIE